MSLITSFTRPNAGGGQFPRVETFSPLLVTGGGALAANWAYLVLIRTAKPILVSTGRVFIGTSSGNIDFGVYSFDGATFTRLASAGSTVAGSGNAVQSLALNAVVALSPGVSYALAIAADNTTVTIGRLSAINAGITAYGSMISTINITALPLPSSILLSGTSTTGTVPWLAAQ